MGTSTDPVAQQAAASFQWSILFMIASVFTVLGTVVIVIARGVRRLDAADELAERL